MKSYTISNQKKIHGFIFALICIAALLPQTTTGFGCPTTHSSCVASRYTNSDGITLDPPSETVNLSGNPSPSIIEVNNIPKCHVIKGLQVTLKDVDYVGQRLLTVALVTPCGDCIILLNSVGTPFVDFALTRSFNNVTFVFSDCNGIPLDCNQSAPFTGTRITKPTDCTPGEYCFNGQLNTTCCSTDLTKTFGKPAVGTWKLFTCIKPQVNGPLTGGSIGSWKLRIIHGLPSQDDCCQSCVC